MGSRRSFILTGLLALALGLGLGLAYAWWIEPTEYTQVTPAEMSAEHRSTWISLVAASYAVENDWGRAQFRLDSLGEGEKVGQHVAAVARRAIAGMQAAPMRRALARLADQLGQRTPEMVIYLATPLPTTTPDLVLPSPLPAQPTPPTASVTPPPTPSATPTFAPPPSPTALPTLTPTPSPTPGYLLVQQERICQTGINTSHIQVNIEDEYGQGIPGIEVWVSWDNGADRFVTGLKPGMGAGYGDFEMHPNVAHNISVDASAVPLVRGLMVEVCPSNTPTQTAYTVWVLNFRTLPPTATPTPSLTPSPTSTLTPSPTPSLTPSLAPADSTPTPG